MPCSAKAPGPDPRESRGLALRHMRGGQAGDRSGETSPCGIFRRVKVAFAQQKDSITRAVCQQGRGGAMNPKRASTFYRSSVGALRSSPPLAQQPPERFAGRRGQEREIGQIARRKKTLAGRIEKG